MRSGASRFSPTFVFLLRFISPIAIASLLNAYEARLTPYRGIIDTGLFWLLVIIVIVYPEFIKREGYYLSYLAGGLAYLLTPYHIDHITFYEITAQVAPLLFLALTVETGTYQPLGLKAVSVAQWFIPVPIIALVYVEFESLRVIALHDAAQGTFDVVVATLVAAGVSLFHFGNLRALDI